MTTRLPRGFRDALRPTNLPAAVAILVVFLAALFADQQNRALHRERLRADITAELTLIRAKLEGNVNGNLQLVRGLIATVATEPTMDQARFADLAGKLLDNRSQIRNIAGAPDLVVSLMYPLAGNEKAIGLDYNDNEQQREAALRARDTGDLVLAGPVDLVQGGRGFIGRFPVFIDDPGGTRDFWGVISAVVDLERLYADSGVTAPGPTFELAIDGKDALGAGGKRFFGDERTAASEPVTADIQLPSGSWRLSAMPRGGWDAVPDDIWLLRLAMLIGGALVVVPLIVTGRLMEERQSHIGELRSRENQLERLSRRLGLALDTSQVGVWEFNVSSGELVWDDRMDELYGMPDDGRARSYDDWRGALHPDDLARAERDFKEAVEVTGHYNSDYRLRLLGGQVRHIRAIGAAYKDVDGSSRIVGVNWDVTTDVLLNDDLKRAKTLTEARNAELLMAKARIEHNSLHDSLTALPNRRYLDERLEMLAAHPGEFAARTGVLHIDLDRFKQINDTLGHAAGDAMLVHASGILKKNVRSGDFVARVGGDEFVVMCRLEGPDPAQDAPYLAGVADRIIAEMRQPVPYEGHDCRFGVSVGIAAEGEADTDLRRLLINADIALYRAKSRGRNRYQFYNDALQAEIVETKRVADEILVGLEEGQFEAWFQPQVDATTLEIAGVEALARWNHPTRGVLAPDAFMKTAEELNVVATIDRMILEQALERFRQWREAGLAVPKISVNVSARRLQDEELAGALSKLHIEPGTVSFELVESIFLDDNDDLITSSVEQIKELGVDIEIDDFGTGYASIVSLLKLKPRRLKIDRQLIMPIIDSPGQRHVVESIVEIGKSLGIEVIAEGVETMEHAGILRHLGCHALQGYAFARPLKAADFVAFVGAQRWREAS
ncbi:MAG: EAL domain-containing protein [Rhizobiaceae bacterium]